MQSVPQAGGPDCIAGADMNRKFMLCCRKGCGMEVRMMRIGEKEKLVMIGDSVTDCGRAYPLGEGNGAMGNGYPQYVQSLLDMNYPERHIRVINMGISGNTSADLRQRWQKDVLDLKPDWVSIMIGINDVWRQFDRCLNTEEHVHIDAYEENLEWMLQQTMPVVKGICLMPPCYMEQNHADEMRAMSDAYGNVVRKLAEKYGLVFADAQKAMDAYFRHYPAIYMSWDRVHPNSTGHMIIAKSFVDAMGFAWNR